MLAFLIARAKEKVYILQYVEDKAVTMKTYFMYVWKKNGPKQLLQKQDFLFWNGKIVKRKKYKHMLYCDGGTEWGLGGGGGLGKKFFMGKEK
jgi:hypothetical protein